MQNISKKRNIILTVILALLFTAVALVFALPIFTAHADGNDTGNQSDKNHNDVDIWLELDANGRDGNALSSDFSDQFGGSRNDAKSILYNNNMHLRVRKLFVSAAIDSYLHKHPDAESTVDKQYPDNYKFDYDSAVKNSLKQNSTAFTVTADTDKTFLVITASETELVDNGRFTIKLKWEPLSSTDLSAADDNDLLLKVGVKVSSTFAQIPGSKTASPNEFFQNTNKDTIVKVGGPIQTDGTEGSNNKVFNVDNFSEITVSLDDWLKNRMLYIKTGDNTDYTTKMVFSNGSPWVVSSVTNFKITGIQLIDKSVISTPIYVNPSKASRISPRVTFSINLTNEGIAAYTDLNYSGMSKSDQVSKFWSDIHELRVTFETLNGDGPYTIVIPMTINPQNPQVITVPSSALSLNVTSTYYYDYNGGKAGKFFNAEGVQDDKGGTEMGYNAIILRPSDIIDYSAPDNFGGIHFVTNNSSKSNEYYSVETLEGENRELRPSAFKITALKNGSSDLKLCVGYFTAKGSTDEKTITVTISINGFGDYEISLPSIDGKRPVIYNTLKAAQFSELISDGYQMTGALSLNEDQLGVHLDTSTNELKLEPLVDRIDGQTNAAVQLEFTNSKSQKVTITTNTFAINVNAGSLFARFDDWQAWLIIAACIIGSILIILLIVWLFVHSISKHRQEEAASQAPLSSYIVKLNSTIAATQAQQRLAANQALSQASNQMLLAGPTATQPVSPDTLQLATGVPSTPSYAPPPPPVEEENTEQVYSEPNKTYSQPKETEEDYNALIARYISDEELLERIFTEKYEPKGMVRRTFFKSKDLQARELDKEKKRIIDRYKTPMPMDEAIMSEKELENGAQASAPKEVVEEVIQPELYVVDLGFDPDEPLYVAPLNDNDEFSDEKIDLDMSPEQARLNELEGRSDILAKELAELKSRLDKAQKESDHNKSLEEEVEAKIAKAEEENAGYSKAIEELEFKLASAKARDKDKITRDIATNEEKYKRNDSNIERWREELDSIRNGGSTISAIIVKLGDTQTQKLNEQSAIATDMEKARADFEAYSARLELVRKKQELQAKIEELSPMLVAVNTADYELRSLQNVFSDYDKERDRLKSDISSVKAQILGASDFDVINTLNSRISDANARLSEIEKEITKSTRRKSELNVEFNSSRRKANDFVEKNNIPLEELIPAEDLVIGNIELDILRARVEAEREEAERKVAAAQAVYDDLSVSATDVTMIAMEIASNVMDIEEELAKVQSELDDINAQMETASDDEKLMLMVDQSDKSDRIEELTKQLEQAHVEGTKRKMDAQGDYDTQLEEAQRALDEANEEFRLACAKSDEFITNTNPLDLIVSGSGVISKDQTKRESENLKKQLERSRNEIEQARLAAEAAQKEAEQARLDAERASNEAKAEAERVAAEALEKAEQARLEAEETIRAEREAAEQERLEREQAAEQARLEAEEAARREEEERAEQERLEREQVEEQARLEAEEAAEQARLEAEERAEQAKREAEETAEQARREAEEAAEQARLEAEERAEQAKREAEEAIEQARRAAQEEIEEMRRKTEEEAEAKRQEEETKRQEEEAKRLEEEERLKNESERKEIIARKVAQRKEQIIGYRNRMKEIASEDDAKNLREQLYTVQTSFDDDERNSVELMDFYNKTMDDIQHEGETAKLKAELAKKPQRVVRKVTERVNRIPKRKPGAGKKGAGSKSAGAKRSAGARPAGARPAGARPRPSGARPAGARPRPSGARPAGARPRPSGQRPPQRRG